MLITIGKRLLSRRIVSGVSRCQSLAFSQASAASEFSSNIESELLTIALTKVHTHGWSEEAIIEAAKELNLPPLATSGFVDIGPARLVQHFLAVKRNHVKEILNTSQSNSKSCESSTTDASFNSEPIGKTFQDPLFVSISHHLDYIKPYRESWPSAIAHLVDPRHCSMVTMNLLTDVIDDISEFSNIQATRLDWYGERVLLLFLYSTTELYMLSDESIDLQDTKDFLKRNIAFYHSIHKSPLTLFSINTLLSGLYYSLVNSLKKVKPN